MTTVIVAGALANKPGNGGEAWVRLSWIQALESLGFQVLFLEQIHPSALVDTRGRPAELEGSWNQAWFDAVTMRFGLQGRAALVVEEGRRSHGLPWEEIVQRSSEADLLVNIGGHLTLPEVKEGVGVRCYVDIDPGFVQIWEATGIPGARLEGHDHYFTIGARIGTDGCPIPTLGLHWVPIRQPVLLEEWPETMTGDRDRFTTVASWRGAFGPVELEGRRLGLKVHEFRRFMETPSLAPGRFEVALNIHPADEQDRQALVRHGWRLADPVRECGHPEGFRRYIQGSGGEFSVAQGVYVETECGWFSDRTVRYLASGKPALVQDTGLEGILPLGRGLLTFRTQEEAVEGAQKILRDYPVHARFARAVAEEFFAPGPALAPLLEGAGVTP